MNLKEAIIILKEGEISEALQVVLDHIEENYPSNLKNIKTILVVGSHDQIPSTISRLKEIPLPQFNIEVMETKYQKPENKQFYKDIAK